jgi:hypothetical protein
MQGAPSCERRRSVEDVMAYYNPELISVMRAALDGVMMRVPADQATPAIKAQLAEIILKAAAQGVTTYDGLISVVASQIQTVLALFI